MGKKDQQVSAFSLDGRFLGFEVEDGYKLKRLRLATVEGERRIKLSKEARASVAGVLTPGDWIRVEGEKKVNLKTSEVKLKAAKITRALPGQPLPAPETAPPKTAPKTSSATAKASILVCQKSDCMKRGGKAVCKALEAALDDRGLTDEVAIRGTGCMKHCKAGPNLVFMPDKSHYTRVKAQDIPALVDEHFPQPPATPVRESNPATCSSASNNPE